MRKMRKLVSLLCAMAMMFAIAAPAAAVTSVSVVEDSAPVQAFSPEFPDAYIEYGESSPNPSVASYSAANDESPASTTTVTVFYEEAYDAETGGILYSRLMNQQEVEEWRAEGAPTEYVPFSAGVDNSLAVQSRGELTLNLVVFPGAAPNSSYSSNLL